MSATLLSQVGPPFLLLRRSERRLVVDHAYGGSGVVVRKIRGKKCRGHDAFMDELGAALQFSYDFGENWSAVHELLCYVDEWLPGDGYVLVVEHAEQLFRDEPIELGAFSRAIEAAGRWWSEPVIGNGRFDRPARPFHVVLEAADPAVEQQLRALGAQFAVFDGA